MGIWLWIKADSDAVTDVIVFIPNFLKETQ